MNAVICSDNIRSFVEAGRYLLRQAGIDTAEAEARSIAMHVWDTDAVGLSCMQPAIAPESRKRFFEIVRQRAAGKPLQYILGMVGFYDHELEVMPGVLIPRPETEVLVDKAIDCVISRRKESLRILDMCCGSGAAGLAVIAKLPAAFLVGADVSPDALSLSDINSRKLGLADRTRFIYSDLFSELDEAEPFDLMVCNPPYVSESEYAGLEPVVRDFEPRLALLAGKDGLDFYRRIIPAAEKYLNPGASCVLEIGAGQKEAVCALAREAGWCAQIKTYPDLAGRDRVVELVKGGKTQ